MVSLKLQEEEQLHVIVSCFMLAVSECNHSY